jgi:glycosyltransferase involved in cell wall biosynthesis
MKLSIVIPALNEEGAIESIIRRCLAAREPIVQQTNVKQVDIVVVSDGSTDRTAEIAKGFKEITVIEFEKNRGYGAAIKEGWKKSNGDLLSFLDADGTCDPKYFIDMCQLMEKNRSDVVIGSRMGPDSKMPRIRRIGNTLYVILLGLLSRKEFTDTASGMRVVRKTSLPRIYPLPDGLHFTPAMSARILMDRELKIDEVPMSYSERVGRSKLKVIRDGFRFLKVIISAAAYTRPSRLTMPVIALISLICAAYAVWPIRYYAEHHELLETMIYRFIFMSLLSSIAVSIYCSTAIAERTIELTLLRYDRFYKKENVWWRGTNGVRLNLGIASLLLVVAFVLVWPGLVSYATTGEIPATTMHWSRMMVAGFFVFDFAQFLATAATLKIIDALNTRQPYLTGSSE